MFLVYAAWQHYNIFIATKLLPCISPANSQVDILLGLCFFKKRFSKTMDYFYGDPDVITKNKKNYILDYHILFLGMQFFIILI